MSILVFVEDPGAANYILGVPELLEREGVSVKIAAAGHALAICRERHVLAEDVSSCPDAHALLKRHDVRLLVVGTSHNPDSFGFSLIAAAQSSGIMSVGFVDMEIDAELRFRGRSGSVLGYAPDWLIVPDEWTKKTYETLGYRSERIRICGNPNYDRTMDFAKAYVKKDRRALRRHALHGISDQQKVVVFVAEHQNGNDPRLRRMSDYSLQGRGGNDARTAIVLEELLDAVARIETKPYVVVRMHPKNTKEEFIPYMGEIDCLHSGGEPLELVWLSDLVVGMTSMLVMEAALLGKPTLSILPREIEKMWTPNTAHGLTPCVFTNNRLCEMITGLLDGDNIEKPTIVYGARKMVTSFLREVLVCH